MMTTKIYIIWQVVVPEAYHATPSTLIMEYIPGKMLVDAIQEHFERVAEARGMTLDELRCVHVWSSFFPWCPSLVRPAVDTQCHLCAFASCVA